MQILIADGDESYLKAFEMRLGTESFKVYGVDNADEAANLGKLYDYDAIVLSETDESVLYVLRQFRAAKVRTPVLAITGANLPGDRIAILDGGADDVMSKPVHIDEVVARLTAVVRRSRGHALSTLTAGPLVLNLSTKTAQVNDKPLHLTGKQYHMLECLMLRKGAVQTKDAIMTSLYGGMDEPELKIIDVFVCKLRQKLKDAGAPGLIETVWGRGYLIRDPERQESPSLAPEIRELVGAERMTPRAAQGSNGLVSNRGAA